MAQKVDVKYVDDLDGSDASGTVAFALDGKSYEIDLSDDNAARLRDSLASFVAAAAAAARPPAAAAVSAPRRRAPPRRSGPTAR